MEEFNVSLQSDREIKRISVKPDKKKELLRKVKLNYSEEKEQTEEKIKRKKIRKNKRKNYSQKDNDNYPRYNSIDEIPKIIIKNRKPRILFMCDVKGWAWWNKSRILKKYLSDEFDIEMVHIADCREGRMFDTDKYDLYFTYGYSYVNYLRNVSFHKRISGVTAHRPAEIIEKLMRKVAITHANSILLYEEMKKIHPIVFYVPNGVDEKMFYPKRPIPKRRSNIIVGHIGRQSPMKGQKEFIEPAIKKSKAKYINNYSNHKNRTPQSELVGVYNSMDVFICASSEDGTPNPALEAAACGRPIISNRIGNMPEFIKDGYNGFIVERNIDAYVEKIKYLRKNRDHLIEMGKNARKTVEEGWTWKIQAERYRNMFKAILRME